MAQLLLWVIKEKYLKVEESIMSVKERIAQAKAEAAIKKAEKAAKKAAEKAEFEALSLPDKELVKTRRAQRRSAYVGAAAAAACVGIIGATAIVELRARKAAAAEAEVSSGAEFASLDAAV